MAEVVLTAICRCDPNHLTFTSPPPSTPSKKMLSLELSFFLTHTLPALASFYEFKKFGLVLRYHKCFTQFYILQKLVFCKEASLVYIKTPQES